MLGHKVAGSHLDQLRIVLLGIRVVDNCRLHEAKRCAAVERRRQVAAQGLAGIGISRIEIQRIGNPATEGQAIERAAEIGGLEAGNEGALMVNASFEGLTWSRD